MGKGSKYYALKSGSTFIDIWKLNDEPTLEEFADNSDNACGVSDLSLHEVSIKSIRTIEK